MYDIMMMPHDFFVTILNKVLDINRYGCNL